MNVIFIGAGLANLEALKTLKSYNKEKSFHFYLINEFESKSYSGMLPGVISGLYKENENNIQLKEFCHNQFVHFIVGIVKSIDDYKKSIKVKDLSNEQEYYLNYEVISLCHGASTKILKDQDHLTNNIIYSHPVENIMPRIKHIEKTLFEDKEPAILVIGGGAAAIELSFALKSRYRNKFNPEIQIYLTSKNPYLFRNGKDNEIKLKLRQNNIKFYLNSEIESISGTEVFLKQNENLETLRVQMIVSSPGYECNNNLDSSLSKCPLSGYILVEDNLLVKGSTDIFASGDCCKFLSHPNSLKGGVNSYFAGPILANNIKCLLEKKKNSFKVFKPSDNYLVLMNTCDGEALGFKWNMVFKGKYVGKWKDYIDKKFMNKFSK